MTYNAGIPTSNQNLSVSQGLIKTNFTVINNLYQQDHDGFNTGSGNGTGYHTQVRFLKPKSPPGALYPIATLLTQAFGTSPNLNTELYLQENRQTSGLLTNLVPSIKAMCRAQVPSSAGAASIISTNSLNFNVASVTWNGTYSFTVVFNTALDYATYFVVPIVQRSGTVQGVSYCVSSLTVSGFVLSVIPNISVLTTSDIIGFMVI